MQRHHLFALGLFLGAGNAMAAGVTDNRRLPMPSVSLPSGGGQYTDPQFGTTVIRVTDSSDGVRCVHAYAYWPAFNADGTRLMLSCDDEIRLYRFNKSTDQVTRDGTLTGSDGYPVQFEGASWNGTYANTMYAVDKRGSRLWHINVAKRGRAGYTLLKDFASHVGSYSIHQLTATPGGGVFSFHTRDDSGNHKDAFVWLRSTNKVYKYPRPSGDIIDETKISKDGQNLMINWEDGRMTLWTFRTGTVRHYDPDKASDNVSGHFDAGDDFFANSDAFNTGLVVRTYTSTRNPDNIVQYKRTNGELNWTICDHVSLRQDEELWVVGSTYCGDGSWSPFENEIFMARTDGAGFVRLAHTRSLGKNSNWALRYYAEPRAVVDRTGRYIVYTSDLGSSSRFDVMIVKVPSAYWP